MVKATPRTKASSLCPWDGPLDGTGLHQAQVGDTTAPQKHPYEEPQIFESGFEKFENLDSKNSKFSNPDSKNSKIWIRKFENLTLHL